MILLDRHEEYDPCSESYDPGLRREFSAAVIEDFEPLQPGRLRTPL